MYIGAIFDWDGVIIDSSVQHERSWEILAEEEGKVLPEGHFKEGFGRKNEYIIPRLLDWSQEATDIRRLADRKEELYRTIIKNEGIDPLPGVRDLLDALKGADIPCCVGSSTPRLNIDTIIRVLGFEDYFSTIICGEDVSQGKPHPDVFLQGAEHIQRDPSCCVVFEDAHVGIAAAIAGGMKVIGVGTTHPVSDLHRADLAVSSLSEVSVESLQKLFS